MAYGAIVGQKMQESVILLPQIIVDVNVGATVTVSQGSTVLTQKQTGSNKLVFNVTNYGDWVVKGVLGSDTQTQTITIDTVKQYSVKFVLFDVKPTLADNSWTTIAKVASQGIGSRYWKVGDSKPLVINGNTYTVNILGFNHDTLSNGSTNNITFGLKQLESSQKMNNRDTVDGGFYNSDLYSYLNNDVYNALPLELRGQVKSTKKAYGIPYSSNVLTNNMKLFLFSEIEVYGTTEYSHGGEGKLYDYFKTTSNRIKSFLNGNKDGWWLRSGASLTDKFIYAQSANNENSPSFNSPNIYYGVCFGFCV